MTPPPLFRSARLSGYAPDPRAAPLYAALFGAAHGSDRLAADLLDWSRHAVAPWTLFHAGREVGVAGFRIGFGTEGLDLSFHFLPDVAGQGLASEFVQAALDHATTTLREDRFQAEVAPDNAISIRVLEKAGFRPEPGGGSPIRMTLTLGRPDPAGLQAQRAASA